MVEPSVLIGGALLVILLSIVATNYFYKNVRAKRGKRGRTGKKGYCGTDGCAGCNGVTVCQPADIINAIRPYSFYSPIDFLAGLISGESLEIGEGSNTYNGFDSNATPWLGWMITQAETINHVRVSFGPQEGGGSVDGEGQIQLIVTEADLSSFTRYVLASFTTGATIETALAVNIPLTVGQMVSVIVYNSSLADPLIIDSMQLGVTLTVWSPNV